jgi:hypothetical protein
MTAPKPKAKNPFKIGDRVLHGTMGCGTVLSVLKDTAKVALDNGNFANLSMDYIAPTDTPKPEQKAVAAKALPAASNDNKTFPIINAQHLLGIDFPPVHFVLPGYIAEGMTILGGRPKLGKSWLALGVCIAVASGGVYLGQECDAGDVLYLALEDNQRRLQDRIKKLLYQPFKSGKPDLSRLSLVTAAPRINAGLIEMLNGWRTGAKKPVLVVIDTLAMVRPPKGRNQDSYDADYATLSPLQQWAGEHRLAVVVVTHVRKMEASDPLEMISGTNGLTGAADTIIVLNRDQDGPKLYGRGRDIEEIEKALKFDAGRWTALGDADEVKRSGQRKKILAAFEESQQAMAPKDIAEAAGLKPENVRYLLRKMVGAGELEKLEYGAYRPVQPS